MHASSPLPFFPTLHTIPLTSRPTLTVRGARFNLFVFTYGALFQKYAFQSSCFSPASLLNPPIFKTRAPIDKYAIENENEN